MLTAPDGAHAEGRIEPSDGTLMCSYHGWRFQGDGKCTEIPQALDAKAKAAACNNSRSCVKSHPTKVRVRRVMMRAGLVFSSSMMVTHDNMP